MRARTAAYRRQFHRTELLAWWRRDTGLLLGKRTRLIAYLVPEIDSWQSGKERARRRSAAARVRVLRLFLRRRLHRILDGIKGFELDVEELPVLLLDLAHVDVLDDVASLGIDRDRPARTFPFHPFHGRDQ